MAPRILFITSNGTGLGHLTRSMAIARRLGEELGEVVHERIAAERADAVELRLLGQFEEHAVR